ncbi:probable 2-carboxy-D-arabinitol-1-phosphatase, partial [Tanacetum coccineum]
NHRNNNTFKPITLTSFTVRSSSSSLTQPATSSSSEVEDDQKLSLKACGTVSFPSLKAAKRVVLVRHGQSTWNAEGRIQGSSDFSILTNKGEAQAETSRQMLIDDSLDICFSR